MTEKILLQLYWMPWVVLSPSVILYKYAYLLGLSCHCATLCHWLRVIKTNTLIWAKAPTTAEQSWAGREAALMRFNVSPSMEPWGTSGFVMGRKWILREVILTSDGIHLECAPQRYYTSNITSLARLPSLVLDEANTMVTPEEKLSEKKCISCEMKMIKTNLRNNAFIWGFIVGHWLL